MPETYGMNAARCSAAIAQKLPIYRLKIDLTVKSVPASFSLKLARALILGHTTLRTWSYKFPIFISVASESEENCKITLQHGE